MSLDQDTSPIYVPSKDAYGNVRNMSNVLKLKWDFQGAKDENSTHTTSVSNSHHRERFVAAYTKLASQGYDATVAYDSLSARLANIKSTNPFVLATAKWIIDKHGVEREDDLYDNAVLNGKPVTTFELWIAPLKPALLFSLAKKKGATQKATGKDVASDVYRNIVMILKYST
jgi:hypothetical protein